MSDLQGHLIEDRARIRQIISDAKTVAVLGIKTEAQREQPAFYVSEFLQRAGQRVIPVPVYYPEVEQILGEKVYRRVADIAEDVDVVIVFRRAKDIPPHIDDIIAKKPRAVWFQLGIRNDEAAKRLAEAGIDVVQDRCSMVEHRRP